MDQGYWDHFLFHNDFIKGGQLQDAGGGSWIADLGLWIDRGRGGAGVFQLTFNPTETNIEARYRLLRFIGKRGVLTHREMATAIDIGVGSIRNYLDKLMVEGFLEGLKSDPKISTEGLRLLHDFWPEEFSFTEQGRFVQSDDVPF